MIGLLALLFLTVSAGAVEAGPVVGAIAGVLTAAGIGATTAVAIAGFLVRTAVSLALSALSRALQKKPVQPGIQTEVTSTGGTTPQKFILGRYATAGCFIAPPNTSGRDGDTPRAFLHYAIALSVVPRCSLLRVIIDDEYAAFASGATGPALGPLAGRAWVEYFDGTQTAASTTLVTAFGTDPDRPWLADMVGQGTCYAVLRFKYERSVFNGLPSVRFEVMGIPLYDPRADSTVGGSGAQRWADRSTWTQTANPVVMIYNILRGIDVGAGDRWGGECAAEDLPLANWFAAMNECDVAVALSGGGTEPQYRAGFEVALEDEPASVIEELLKTCAGAIVEVGGVWKIRVGPPALPAFFVTDDDVIVSQEQQLEPFPSLSETYNGIACTYPEPEALWEPKEAPARTNATWEAQDGNRRLMADLELPACPWPNQVQRLMLSLITDHRRMRRHRITLPPEAAVLEPLDTVGWTSARYGYTAKTFEITALTDSLMTVLQVLSLRERDAADFAWSPANAIAVDPVAAGTAPPVVTGLPDLVVDTTVLSDGSADRRVAISVAWDPADLESARGVAWEVTRVGDTAVLAGATADAAAGELLITEAILPAVEYEVRARLVMDAPTAWSAPQTVETDSVLLGTADIDWTELDGQIDGGWIQAGKISADFLRVNRMLTIEQEAGLAYGKASAIDTTDGIYFGVATGAGGTASFGFAASRTNAGKRQSLRITPEDGFRIRNARHFVTAATVPTAVTATTSVAKTNLPAGTKTIDVATVAGGGGGGSSGAWANSPTSSVNPGTNGGNTILRLWDGTTLKHEFIATGGAAGTLVRTDNRTERGQAAASNALGTAGESVESAQHSYEVEQGGNTRTRYHDYGRAANPSTGYNVGGSAGSGTNGQTNGGTAGQAGQILVPGLIDCSTWAAPAYEVVIGSGGAGGAATTQDACTHGFPRGGAGAAGRPGLVIFSHSAVTDIPADVVPVVPTATGSFAKGNNVAGQFPDLGPGLWIIDTGTARVALNLTALVIAPGHTIELFNDNSGTFFASQRPSYPASANARTIFYQFYSMTQWG